MASATVSEMVRRLDTDKAAIGLNVPEAADDPTPPTAADVPAIGQMASAGIARSSEQVVADIEEAIEHLQAQASEVAVVGRDLIAAIREHSRRFQNEIQSFAALSQSVGETMRAVKSDVANFGK